LKNSNSAEQKKRGPAWQQRPLHSTPPAWQRGKIYNREHTRQAAQKDTGISTGNHPKSIQQYAKGSTALIRFFLNHCQQCLLHVLLIKQKGAQAMTSQNTTATPPRTYNTQDLQRMLHISPVSIWRNVRAGKLPAPKKICGKNIWLAAEVDNLLQ